MMLQSCILRAKALLTKTDPVSNNISKEIDDFMARGAKGSKKFRKFFNAFTPDDIPEIRAINTVATLINLPVPPESCFKKYVTIGHTII
jgi:hypothetical protein